MQPFLVYLRRKLIQAILEFFRNKRFHRTCARRSELFFNRTASLPMSQESSLMARDGQFVVISVKARRDNDNNRESATAMSVAPRDWVSSKPHSPRGAPGSSRATTCIRSPKPVSFCTAILPETSTYRQSAASFAL